MDESKNDNQELIALVEAARAGDKESLNRLAEEATVRLHEFVFRLTLQEDLTQDVVQETITEMLQVFNKLRHVERFWYWLYGIAYNKLRRQYSKRKRHRAASLSDIPYDVEGKKGDETVANVVSDELKQIVLQAMQTLDPRHRAILTMRCYDQMSYAEIAGMLDCTEFGARALFYRAKKSLAKKLAGFGLGKGALLTGLIVFGKMTAVNEASAASVVVSTASLQVGAMAATAAVLTSKAALITITAGALTTGTLVSPISPFRSETPDVNAVTTNLVAEQPAHDGPHMYFFPDGPQGAVMLRTEALEKQVETRWGVMQNAIGNFQWIGDTMQQNNAHWYREDLSVLRLPTDRADLRSFLTRMDGQAGYQNTVQQSGKDLLVICGGDNGAGTHPIRTVRHHNVLVEDYFQPYRPEGVSFVDQRDAMRKRGWTFFKVSGHLNEQRIKGSGRLPFVYAKLNQRSPWLQLEIGNSIRLIDTVQGASARNAQGIQRYGAGTFFRGLIRPWQGLHVIDSVRRDAALAELPFTTQRSEIPNEVHVTVQRENVSLIYSILLDQDLISGINILINGKKQGALRFEYLQELPSSGSFTQPRAERGENSGPLDMQWMFSFFGPTP